MGQLLSYGIAPHGFSIIEEISGDEKEIFRVTRDNMKLFGRAIMKDKPDTIIVLTPHGLRLKGYNAVYTTFHCKGSLSANDQTVTLDYLCDRALAFDILEELEKQGLPVVGCNYGAMSGDLSNIPMDWGTLIPLWFCTDASYQPEIVVIGPTREMPLEKLVVMGEAIANVCLESSKKVSIIASADQGHCHDEKGPYGYHKASKVLDDYIMKAIKDNDLSRLMTIDEALILDGKPDSIWQMLILEGVLRVKPKKGRLLSYEVPTYFGMAVAVYE